MGGSGVPGTGETASILVETRAGAVARLLLNRPGQRNALSLELLEALSAALGRIGGDAGVQAVVIAGAGGAFSAGHDLRELESASPDEIEALFASCSRVMESIHALPQPVVARVHGVATAAGCQLVAACDLAVAAEEATFATPGIRIGLFCSTPAVPLVRAIGRKRALEMLLGGGPIDARTALDWGLVNRVVPGPRLDDAVDELLAPILGASGPVVAAGKATFYRQVDRPEGEAYGIASAAMCRGASEPEAREGIAAFLARREPSWKRG